MILRWEQTHSEHDIYVLISAQAIIFIITHQQNSKKKQIISCRVKESTLFWAAADFQAGKPPQFQSRYSLQQQTSKSAEQDTMRAQPSPVALISCSMLHFFLVAEKPIYSPPQQPRFSIVPPFSSPLTPTLNVTADSSHNNLWINLSCMRC